MQATNANADWPLSFAAGPNDVCGAGRASLHVCLRVTDNAAVTVTTGKAT